jgi:C-terminal processing protease CtpA/Prc
MKSCITTICVLVVAFFCEKTYGQTADSVRTYIDSAIYIMQSNSLNGKHLNWKQIRDSAHIVAAGAKTYHEAFPALVYAFKQLKDDHGMVANADTFYRYPAHVDFSKTLSEGIKKEFLKGNRIVTRYLNNSIAYLRIPTMQVTNQKDIDEKGNMLRDSLCMLLSKNPTGIIVDLRMNNGGNSAPMQSGIGPLFQNTILGYGVDKDDRFLAPTKMKDGIIINEKGEKTVDIKTTCSFDKHTPIAVLIGPSTVSSAEITAAFLKPQSNVKLFGETTPGFCSVTEGFLFRNGQGYLLFSVSRIADSKKHIYRDNSVTPHVFIQSEDNYEDMKADPTVKAALKWLKQKK